MRKEAYPTDYDACVRKVGRDGATYEPELVGNHRQSCADLPASKRFSGKTVVPFMTHGTSGLHVQDVTKLCPGGKVLNGHGIFNSYQVSTNKNAPENMGNYQADIDRWLGKIGF